MAIHHSFDDNSLQALDTLSVQHSSLFDQVPEYGGLKRPKHHFCAHLPVDTWRHGPLRGVWCFGFEGFNSVIKEGASSSNMKSEVLTTMKYWSMRSAAAMCLGWTF